jgi:hypothetical protein
MYFRHFALLRRSLRKKYLTDAEVSRGSCNRFPEVLFDQYTLNEFGFFYRLLKDLKSSVALLQRVAKNLSLHERRPR